VGELEAERRKVLAEMDAHKRSGNHQKRSYCEGVADGLYLAIMMARRSSPTDLKLSDCPARRDGCVGEGGGAAGVTRGAVRSSAWLGVTDCVESMAKGRPNGEKLPPVAVACAQKRRATPDRLRWRIMRLTKGLRATERDGAPGTDARCVEQRRDRQRRP
jgi:hypothetical protein